MCGNAIYAGTDLGLGWENAFLNIWRLLMLQARVLNFTRTDLVSPPILSATLTGMKSVRQTFPWRGPVALPLGSGPPSLQRSPAQALPRCSPGRARRAHKTKGIAERAGEPKHPAPCKQIERRSLPELSNVLSGGKKKEGNDRVLNTAGDTEPPAPAQPESSSRPGKPLQSLCRTTASTRHQH